MKAPRERLAVVAAEARARRMERYRSRHPDAAGSGSGSGSGLSAGGRDAFRRAALLRPPSSMGPGGRRRAATGMPAVGMDGSGGGMMGGSGGGVGGGGGGVDAPGVIASPSGAWAGRGLFNKEMLSDIRVRLDLAKVCCWALDCFFFFMVCSSSFH